MLPLGLFISLHHHGSPSSLRSSDGDSDRAAEAKKKRKKKRRHRDSDPEQHSPDAARSHRNRSSEERESRKRHYADVQDSKHEDGHSPEKRRRTDCTEGGGHLLPSHHTAPTNGSSYGHLNGHTGIHLFSKIPGLLK